MTSFTSLLIILLIGFLPLILSFLLPSNRHHQKNQYNYVKHNHHHADSGNKFTLLQQAIKEENGVEEEPSSLSSSSLSTTNSKITNFSQQRRSFLATVSGGVSAALLTSTSQSENTADAAGFPFLGEPRTTSLSFISNKKNSTSASAIRQPTKEFDSDKELIAESCLLELLPVKVKEFRTLEKELYRVSSLREDEKEPPSANDFKAVTEDLQKTLQYFDDQRTRLQPVFNQEDSTLLSIEKATRGEYLLENFRNELLKLIEATKHNDDEGTLKGQKQALFALAEIGEVLVDSFPYDVPTEGKFSFLPRLLGRAKITFLITRPPAKKGSRGEKEVVLGNVTILADGFAAPITAGNFVDLSARGFYNGLPVKEMKKKFGVEPTLTLGEENIVAYDFANTVDKLTGADSIVQKAFGNVMKKKTEEEEEITSGGSILTTTPILGSFNEGFYDPLTAKPRRLPLEIVQYDRTFRRAKLSYESGFSPTSIKQPTSTTKLQSVLIPVVEFSPQTRPLLTFDIPGLVAMNHPDKNLNGGSSEFFVLTKKDLKPERASLLNGKYAPFGYVVSGLDIMKNLQAGDQISATYVNEWGKLNLKKVRGSSFADALSQSEDDDDDDT